MKREVISTKKAPAAIGPYSQGIRAEGELIFTAGQVPLDPESGELIGGDIQAQTRQVIANVAAILKEAGSSLANVVKTTVFLKDMNDFAAMNEVYKEHFGELPPARSAVEVARLPKDARVEIEAIAIVSR